MPDHAITIRKAETIDDYLACQRAQKLAWGITDDSYLVPLATLVGAQLHGGLVLGAFQPTGEAVGLSFAFLGKIDGRLCLYSQLTGVVPGQQGQGLGARLKAAQREFARAEKLDCLAWAFDPLQAGNARFNLEKLGATVSRFVPNMYGRRTDALNTNATTDRLIAEWSSDGETVEMTPTSAEGWPRLIETNPIPVARPDRLLTGSSALIEIPADIGVIRKDEPELAEAWARAVRESFQAAFQASFRAEGFIRGGDGRCYYLLRRTRIGHG